MSKIVTVIPYAFYPPSYGGALRCYYMLKEMAKCHSVTLITVQPADDFKEINTETPFPSNVEVVSTFHEKGYTSIFNLLPDRLANAINSKILRRSLRRKGNLYLLKTFPTFKRVLKESKPDFVVYENLECFSLLHHYVQQISKGTKNIYDAHNVDSELWQQQFESSKLPHLKLYAEGAAMQEMNLHKNASLIMCCSEADQQKFLQFNQGKGNFKVIPNGVDTSLKLLDNNPDKHKIKNLLFCGTLDYAPNAEGILWFYNNVFIKLKKQLPGIRLTVIGKLNHPQSYAYLKNDADVDFIGTVSNVVPYYLSSSIAIVPLLSGSGTRLKILEAMSIGNPVVSTTIGAEGLELVPDQHFKLADTEEEFIDAIQLLLNKPDRFLSIKEEANQLVKNKYDWNVIGEAVNNELKKI